jgi:hypothetical protein
MTEAEWLACSDPPPMRGVLNGKASNRKMRLFAIACCRQIWQFLNGESRAAVEVMERYLEGQATLEELEDVHRHLSDEGLTNLAAIQEQAFRAALAASATGWTDPVRSVCGSPDEIAVAYSAADYTSNATAWNDLRLGGGEGSIDRLDERLAVAYDAAYAVQAALLKDIFGPLLFRSLSVDPGLLTWSDGTVVKLVQGIYDDRAFDHLPVLADALVDAGCDNADVLAHLRGPGPHVRGCWVLDLLLGKE